MLEKAYKAWLDCSTIRAKRERFKRYTYGQQWEDIVYDPMRKCNRTERQIIEDTGRSPITNNVIRQLVKTIIGKYRHERELPDDDRLVKIYRRNLLTELDARLLEEFLISGVAVQRITRECRRPGAMETFVDNVNPADFFINAIRDPRGWDVELVGELRDMSLPELIARYGKGDSKTMEHLRRLYTGEISGIFDSRLLGTAENHHFHQSPTGRCRVIEVWTLEMTESLRCHDTRSHRCYELPKGELGKVERENRQRQTDGKLPIKTRLIHQPRWVCRVYAPDGTLIDTRPSTAPHGEHPYVVKLYPLTDGEVHPFVEDVIDQQRHINRLITMIDHIMGVSAKGVLLFPLEAKIDELTWRDIRHQWSTCGGIIPYRSRSTNKEPAQITSSGLDAGASKLVELQMRLVQEVTGVNDAISGKNISSGVGADRYQQQVQNATVALLDLMETFSSLLELRDRKILLT
ncbi:MAG: hypothetical protein K2O00_02190 [Muribaculaceae bacterium]|nr:hypothetical protein [Muribaculaceae bacterium]